MNKRTTYLAAVCLVSAVAIADQKQEPSAAEREAMKQERIARIGGLLPRPGTPSGRIVFANCQSAVPEADLRETQERNSSKIRGVCHWTNGVAVTAASASAVRKAMNADFAVFIVDDASLPMSLVALEARWAFVNVAPLKGDGVGEDLVRHRTKNELARIYGVLCGGVSSRFKSKLVNQVDSPEDLNGCTDELPVDITANMMQYVESRGCKPVRLVPYTRACQEGWAPAPTNDVQKAIWDKVHALPTEPIKIKPETKKVRD